MYFASSSPLCCECYKDKQDWTATFFHLVVTGASANLKQALAY